MRLIANKKNPVSEILRLMIFASEDEVLLFGFDTENDSASIWDMWCKDIDQALEIGQAYGVAKEDWKEIENPLDNCQHDWIARVRINGCDTNNPTD